MPPKMTPQKFARYFHEEKVLMRASEVEKNFRNYLFRRCYPTNKIILIFIVPYFLKEHLQTPRRDRLLCYLLQFFNFFHMNIKFAEKWLFHSISTCNLSNTFSGCRCSFSVLLLLMYRLKYCNNLFKQITDDKKLYKYMI